MIHREQSRVGRAGEWVSGRARRGWTRWTGWTRSHPFTTALIVMTVVAAFGYFRLQHLADAQHRETQREINDNRAHVAREDAIVLALHADLGCVETWANKTARRNTLLTPLANARIEHLFAAFRVALDGHTDKARALAVKAIREDEAYLRKSARYPVPQPELRCRLLLPQPPQPTSTGSSTPRVPPATTSSATRTTTGRRSVRTVTAPGPTTTVTAAGRHVTRTVTTTRTVTAPLPAVVCDHLPTPLRRRLC